MDCSPDPGQWFVFGWLCGALSMGGLWLWRSKRGHRHSWSGWIENLGRFAIGERYRMCDCGAVEIEGERRDL